MPCKCDGYMPTYKEDYDEAHQMCCQAQSLAHKLGRLLENNGIDIPGPVKTLLKLHRGILLKHKQKEFNKDIEEAKELVHKLESKVKQIKGLGGIPTESTLLEVESARRSLDVLTKQNRNDLLGDV